MSAPSSCERLSRSRFALDAGGSVVLRYPCEHCREAFGMELGERGNGTPDLFQCIVRGILPIAVTSSQNQPSARKCSSQTPTPR